ncbi:MAG: LPXTG cell wall anchor domain-containing protein [Dysosmobacter sp.]|nr:LPXTG cell wall anchor domain-containing protein [Dysosmobacter sp.]
MEHNLLTQMATFLRKQHAKRIWYRVVSCLAVIVVFCTTYALILPAITMEHKTICGLEEHTHTDDCYVTELVYPQSTMDCPVEAVIHTHSKECYDSDGNLICGYADFVVHTHDENCYSEDGSLICTLSEIEEHIHTRDCYTEKRTLICEEEEDLGHQHAASCYRRIRGDLVCGLEEEDGHTHTDDCYEITQVLDCDSDEEDHEHDDSCYTEERELICDQEESEGHHHTDDCYEWTEELICTEEEREPGHIHDDSCYETEYVLDCDEDEVELHTHTDSCYDEDGKLICGKLEIEEHQHTAACILPPPDDAEPEEVKVLACGLKEHTHSEACYAKDDAQAGGSAAAEETHYICGLEEHTHSETCYNENGELICGLEEHIHTAECLPPMELTEEEQARIDEVIAMIDALPTSEEVESQLAAFDEAGDEDGFEAYFMEIFLQSRTAYAYYEDLGADLQEQVTNSDKLLELSWLWSAQTLEITDTVTVYQMNSYSQSTTTLVQGGSVRDKLGSGMSYTYWDVIVVEKDSSGKLYVAQYVTANGDKQDYKASTADGFVLLLYNTSVNVAVGQAVTVDFNYKTTGDYNSSGYGTVSFGSDGSPKPVKDNSDKLEIVQGADTRDLIEVNLYDYGTNINDLYNSDNNKYPGFQQEFGSLDVGDSFNKWMSFNFGNNITSDLAAGKPNVTVAGGTGINATTNGANSPISGAMQATLGSDGFPALADGTSLSYLFSNNTYAVKKNSDSINGLFQYHDDTGAYTFNSRENHAQFNSSDDTFTLYSQIISSNFMMYPFGNFLPFNDIVHLSAQASTIDRAYLETIADSAQHKYNNGAGDAYGTLSTQLGKFLTLMDNAYPNGWTGVDCMNEYFKASGISRTFTQEETLVQNLYSIDFDEPTDFYFGMEMKMNFMQPKGGLTGKDGKQPMVFYFTGDDDVWVYLDGTLFLDLSGIHRHVGGEIDFVKGEIRYYSLDVSTGDVGTTPYQTVKFSDLVDSGLLNERGTFKDYSTHSFNFYYMERGSGSGVCRMNFNFPLLRQNSISVTKELSVDESDKLDLLGNPDFRFQVLKEDGTEPFIGEGVSYDILDTAGNKLGSGTTDANGVFTIKAGQTAVFSNINENAGRYFVRELLEPDAFEQYGKISVDGSSQTENYNVTVGSDDFRGVDSPIKDMSSGNTAFHFNNQVTFKKLGSLEITKKLETYPKTRTVPQFQFYVTLDGTPLSVDTAYTVGSETRFVKTEGIITLAPGETAKIANILAGSRFTVQETAASSYGYTVTYTGDGLTQSSGENGVYVSGTIQTNSAVAVTVINTEGGTTVTIPGVKTLENADQVSRAFTFRLAQVTDAAGNTLAENGTTQEATVQFPLETGQETAFQFNLNYLEKDILSYPAVFYYRITENAAGDTGVRYDAAAYVVEVTVSQTDGVTSAQVTGLWKDGTAIWTSSSADAMPQISFVNTVLQYELPETGGSGTNLYTMGGLLLMAGAGLLLYIQTRRRKEDPISS